MVNDHFQFDLALQTQAREQKQHDDDTPAHQIMVWLEPKRYVTLAYRFQQRPPTMQDLEKLAQARREVIRDRSQEQPLPDTPTMLKVHFAGTIYHPDPKRDEPDLPQLELEDNSKPKRAFKKQYQNLRKLLRKEAVRRFKFFGLSDVIDLQPFLIKLQRWQALQDDYKQKLDDHKQKLAAYIEALKAATPPPPPGVPLAKVSRRPRPPKALPPKPDLQAYLRAALRKMLIGGCHLPRKEQKEQAITVTDTTQVVAVADSTNHDTKITNHH
jgi:hypothetical protein